MRRLLVISATPPPPTDRAASTTSPCTSSQPSIVSPALHSPSQTDIRLHSQPSTDRNMYVLSEPQSGRSAIGLGTSRVEGVSLASTSKNLAEHLAVAKPPRNA